MDTFNKNKVLFLWLNEKEFHPINAKRRGVDTANVYKNLPKFLKIIRRIQIILNLPYISPWINKWKKEIDKYDTIIIHASKITSPVVKYIYKKNQNIRIIVWYWNPVSKCEKLSKYPESICERWTFDEKDARDYKINYNTQYYFNDIKLSFNKQQYDVYFVGGDKGRLPLLLDLEQKLIAKNIKTHFHITKTSKKTNNNYRYKQRINYNQVLENLSKSKAILDIVASGQVGLTLRPLEAMYLRKKLITNDQTILERDIYNKENIFVLGHDDINEINTFINSPFKELPSATLEKYDFDSWIKRFK